MKYIKKTLCVFLLVSMACGIHATRFLNLGLTNILDGGPIRPRAGWYFQSFTEVYTTNRFLDNNGNFFGGVPSPRYDLVTFFSQFIYEFDRTLFNARYGFQAILPIEVYAHMQKNPVGLSTSGAGFSDVCVGAFLQWEPVYYNGRELFVHRLSFDVILPTGDSRDQFTISPGNNIYYINPYWAASLFITPKLSVSWRGFYTWYSMNKCTGAQIGDAMHLNFDAAVELYPKLWAGLVGYLLHSLHNDRKCGIKVPDSKERVLAIGPGFLYAGPHEVDVFSYLYFETKTRNRTEGIKFIFRFIKHF